MYVYTPSNPTFFFIILVIYMSYEHILNSTYDGCHVGYVKSRKKVSIFCFFSFAGQNNLKKSKNDDFQKSLLCIDLVTDDLYTKSVCTKIIYRFFDFLF